MNKTLDLDEAAAMLYTCPETVQRLAKSGVLPGCKPGKKWVFLADDLVEWLKTESRKNLKAKTTRKAMPQI